MNDTLQIGRIEFATCPGCTLQGHCNTNERCLQPLAVVAMEEGRYEGFRFIHSSAQPLLQGWECPRCAVVHAPTVPRCGCTGQAKEAPQGAGDD